MPPTTPPSPVSPPVSRWPIVAAVAVVAIALVVASLIHRHNGPVAAAPTPTPVPSFVGNAQDTAPGTQTVSFSEKDGKLASGPPIVKAALNQYVLFHPTAVGSAHEYEFYVDSYGEFEVDVANADGSHSGDAYFKATKAGTFAYGIEDDDTGTRLPVGQMVVK